LQNNLVLIFANFGFLVDTISKLKTFIMALTKSLEIVNSAIKKLKCVSGEIGVLTNSKLQNILGKTPELKVVKSIEKYY
jgi:hypothetical protein